MKYEWVEKNGETIYLCKSCPASFKLLELIKSHVRTKCGTEPAVGTSVETPEHLQCDFCPRTFSYRSTYEKHKSLHFDCKDPWQCEECSKCYFSKSNLEAHLAVHSGVKPHWQCDICSNFFASKGNLEKHKLLHTESGGQWQCDTCSKSYLSKHSLDRHKLTHSEPTVQCPRCPKLFYTKYALKQHFFSAHEKQEKQKLACDMCNFCTTEKSYLKEHTIKKHTKNYPFVCDLCLKGYVNKTDYNIHRQSVHEGLRFYCTQCPKSFRYKHNLVAHEQGHTSDPQPKPREICQICGKSYASLIHHMAVHVKPFVCDLCGKRFAEKQALRFHVRSKHTRETPFKCVLCGKGFTRKDSLKSHMGYKHSGDVKRTRHELKDNPLQCHSCDQVFTKKMAFFKHLKNVHDGAKQYKCEVCGEQFRVFYKLKEHMDKH